VLAVIFERLVEQSDEKKWFIGAPGGMLGELLEDKYVGLVRTAGGELEEFAQLVNEEEHTGVAGIGCRRVDFGKSTKHGGAVEAGFVLSPAYEVE
jgi:hypothetical protein